MSCTSYVEPKVPLTCNALLLGRRSGSASSSRAKLIRYMEASEMCSRRHARSDLPCWNSEKHLTTSVFSLTMPSSSASQRKEDRHHGMDFELQAQIVSI